MTIYEYLKPDSHTNRTLNGILKSGVGNIPVEEFFKKFGKMDKKQIAQFIIKGDQSYKLGKMGAQSFNYLKKLIYREHN